MFSTFMTTSSPSNIVIFLPRDYEGVREVVDIISGGRYSREIDYGGWTDRERMVLGEGALHTVQFRREKIVVRHHWASSFTLKVSARVPRDIAADTRGILVLQKASRVADRGDFFR